MNKANLFILNEDLEKVTHMLYDLKLIEFFEISHEKFSSFEHLDSNDQSSNLLKLRSAITILKKYFKKDNLNIVENPITKVLENKKNLDQLNNEISHLKDDIKRQKILAALKLSKKDLDEKNRIIGFIPASKVKYLKNLKKLNISFKKEELDNRIYFTCVTNKPLEFVYKEFYLPHKIDIKTKGLLIDKTKERSKILVNLSNLANSSLKELQRDELRLTKELSVLEIKSKFAKTNNFCVLSGFIPKSESKILSRKLEEILGNKFDLTFIQVKDDSAPIKLNNPLFSNKFEALLKMYSLPKYTELDPTFLMFITFPLFFGFILGDVIYGLISLIFFSLLKVKMTEIKDFLSILQLSAVTSMIFGVIYGEFMGFEFHGAFYGLFERAHEPETLLIIAVLFGLFHVNLGLILGFLNDLKTSIKKAVCNKASWIILQLAAGLLGLGFYAGEGIAIIVGSIFFLLSVVLIYMGHGFIGIIEVPSFFTNILSYARLMAVGLSSVAIAVLINEFSVSLFSGGVFSILAGILLFTLGHIFNIVLGNFEGFLHTLRLHYVEHFTKFYTGGGKEFVPFGTKLHKLEEE